MWQGAIRKKLLIDRDLMRQRRRHRLLLTVKQRNTLAHVVRKPIQIGMAGGISKKVAYRQTSRCTWLCPVILTGMKSRGSQLISVWAEPKGYWETMETKELDENNSTGTSLGTFQIHIDNIVDGGVIRDLHAPSVDMLVERIRRLGWKIDSVSFYGIMFTGCQS